ncbi:hypothetical protein SAMN04488542_12653 [Fontibacillus panacisegetis]|uniref:Uncharacterized protein n=1 Tax=Fontibacillus panacisegetis TaxID=670482 RepID=A0A1G7RN01_9BACL|nr:hypothetical protein SAMN04488542_12653 [Fontibacillus panacisegetis]
MMDVYMLAALAAIFGTFYAFARWCGHVVDDEGRGEQ